MNLILRVKVLKKEISVSSNEVFLKYLQFCKHNSGSRQ